ncbi:hypothetical protein EUBVEN_02671 [Eubacterium ventriosum ATCC 27560]|uniref:Uncharacterized protein n=1 Tax=Eubacterium ventriosum ATCC 27560 TaxID=411463 RepID=A5ZAC4_9FIRM|nr:hypothetical protein EUBVEN_02671 [Eubacterium ventriosum ATCC 27560]
MFISFTPVHISLSFGQEAFLAFSSVKYNMFISFP